MYFPVAMELEHIKKGMEKSTSASQKRSRENEVDSNWNSQTSNDNQKKMKRQQPHTLSVQEKANKNVSLEDLIAAKFLQPNSELELTWNQKKHIGKVLSNGSISTIINGEEFTFPNPSAWVVHVNGMWTPRSGWRVIKDKSSGECIKLIKERYLRRSTSNSSVHTNSTISQISSTSKSQTVSSPKIPTISASSFPSTSPQSSTHLPSSLTIKQNLKPKSKAELKAELDQIFKIGPLFSNQKNT